MDLLRYAAPWGEILLCGAGDELKGLYIRGQRRAPAELRGEYRETPLLRATAQWLDAYFGGKKPSPGLLPLAPEGNAFQLAVWRHLLAIPYGETATYGAIARAVAREMGRERMSAQAVGGAVGRNPISIIIPCHRVIGADGWLTGYAGGLAVKAWLLRHEGARQ